MLFDNYKKRSERYNTISHAIAAGLALPAAITLLVFASIKGDDAWRIVSFSIYGLTLFLLYLASSLYHGSSGHSKKFFAKIDHIAIYLLIAGSYTPFTLVALQGALGWTLFGVVWALAIIGIVIDSLHNKGPRGIQLGIYFVMGWMFVIALPSLHQTLALGGLTWLIVGGLFYTVGISFYALEGRIRFGHFIWHLFVIIGSACHYFTIFYYLL